MSSQSIPFIPDTDAFFSATMDVWPYSAPPLQGAKRLSNVNILITGTFPEGMRQKITSGDAYTHIIICDPSLEIHDGYTNSGTEQATTADYLAIPAGQTQNYWSAKFTFTAKLGTLGRRKIICADRAAIGDFTKNV